MVSLILGLDYDILISILQNDNKHDAYGQNLLTTRKI